MTARALLESVVKENHGDGRVIEIKCTGAAADSLMPLLRELQRLGSGGSSRNIKIEDWDGKSDFGFDGDGAAKITGLKLDGKDYHDKD